MAKSQAALTKIRNVVIVLQENHTFDNLVNDYTSILKFVEHNWALSPLSAKDANANNLLEAFDFAQSAR